MSENCDYCGLPPPYPDWCVIEGQCAKDQARIRAAYLRGLEDAAKVAAGAFYNIPDYEKDVTSKLYYDGMEVMGVHISAAIRALAKEKRK